MLDRHAALRRQRLATISLIFANENVARRLWEQSHPDRSIADVAAGFLDEPWKGVDACVSAIIPHADLRRFAVIELLRRRPAVVIADRPTTADWTDAWADLGEDHVAIVGRAICAGSTTGECWTGLLSNEVTPGSAIAAVAQLIPPIMTSAIWIRDLPGRVADVGPVLAMIAVHAPHWSLGGAVSADEVDRLRIDNVAGRVGSLLQSGIVSAAAAENTGSNVEPSISVATAAAIQADADDLARSAAERILFSALQNDPATRGLFSLNVPLDFRFGPRSAEADLYAESSRLVVEVDGYYHFTNAAAFNRDRRKDWHLQQNRYWFHRVLADEIHADVSVVLDRIKLILQDCRRRMSKGGP